MVGMLPLIPCVVAVTSHVTLMVFAASGRRPKNSRSKISNSSLRCCSHIAGVVILRPSFMTSNGGTGDLAVALLSS